MAHKLPEEAKGAKDKERIRKPGEKALITRDKASNMARRSRHLGEAMCAHVRRRGRC